MFLFFVSLSVDNIHNARTFSVTCLHFEWPFNVRNVFFRVSVRSLEQLKIIIAFLPENYANYMWKINQNASVALFFTFQYREEREQCFMRISGISVQKTKKKKQYNQNVTKRLSSFSCLFFHCVETIQFKAIFFVFLPQIEMEKISYE